MEKFEEESIGFDDTFEIECLIYDMLEKTISKAVDDELHKDGETPLIIAKETMIKNILAHNIDGLEEQQYMTVGPEGKTYLCGSWLMRPVLTDDGSYIPTMDYIKAKTDCTNIIFLPNKTGIDMRKELWFAKNTDYTSYNLPKDCRIENPEEGMPPIEMMGMGGRRPPMGAGGLSAGMGRPPQPEAAHSDTMAFAPAGEAKALLSPSALIETLRKTISSMIENTIRQSVEESIDRDKLPQPKDKDSMIKGIAARNITEMEKGKYIFAGDDGTVYLCGDWLLRQIPVNGVRMPVIGFLKQQFHQYENIVYRPDIRGTILLSQMKK